MLETIKVSNDTELGYRIINVDEYDINIHKIYSVNIGLTLEPMNDLDVVKTVPKTRTSRVKVQS